MCFRLFSIACLLTSIVSNVIGQGSYSTNAFLFSQPHVSGSARTIGLAGAQTALGADLGSLSSNPAGLGFYRKSEWGFTPQFVFPSTTSSDGQTSLRDQKLKFVLNNFGVAFCGLRDDIVESKWRGGTFTLGFTRLSNFQNTFTYQTDNHESSFADYLVLLANSGYNSNNYNRNEIRTLEDLAFGTYVINGVPIYEGDSVVGFNPNRFYNLLPQNGPTTIRQSETVNTSGGMNEWSAGYGGNYDNKLFFGASLNLVSLRHNVDRLYDEILLNNLSQPDIMTSMSFNESLRVRGTGVNLKVGIIGVINDYIRTGLSFKTPSIIGIRETYDASMYATYRVVNEPELPTSASKTLITQTNNYTLYTPFVANWGLALFMNKAGFISGEIEYVDYRSSSVSGRNKANYVSANQEINSNFRDAINFKVGAELRYDVLRFRAGYAYQPTVYNNKVNVLDRRVRSGDQNTFTAGIGVRTNEFFLDLAYARTQYTSNYAPYLMPKEPSAPKGSEPNITTENRISTVTIGAGFFF